MLPKDELRIITTMIIPEETYHKKIQEQLDKTDKVKHHQPKVDNTETWKDLLTDKLLGILGG
jgi:hypothetical protein